jgi:hypothetical protein
MVNAYKLVLMEHMNLICNVLNVQNSANFVTVQDYVKNVHRVFSWTQVLQVIAHPNAKPLNTRTHIQEIAILAKAHVKLVHPLHHVTHVLKIT